MKKKCDEIGFRGSMNGSHVSNIITDRKITGCLKNLTDKSRLFLIETPKLGSAAVVWQVTILWVAGGHPVGGR